MTNQIKYKITKTIFGDIKQIDINATIKAQSQRHQQREINSLIERL